MGPGTMCMPLHPGFLTCVLLFPPVCQDSLKSLCSHMATIPESRYILEIRVWTPGIWGLSSHLWKGTAAGTCLTGEVGGAS